MTKILLLSDSHSFIDSRVLEYAKQADQVWHAGDIGNMDVTDQIAKQKPLKAVYGNIDDHICRATYPLDLHFMVEKVKIFITHIGGYPNRYTARVKKILEETKPDLYICGHSHILKVIYDDKMNTLHMNPGAVGNHGIHQVRTMLRFEINNDKIENLEVVELGRRG